MFGKRKYFREIIVDIENTSQLLEKNDKEWDKFCREALKRKIRETGNENIGTGVGDVDIANNNRERKKIINNLRKKLVQHIEILDKNI